MLVMRQTLEVANNLSDRKQNAKLACLFNLLSETFWKTGSSNWTMYHTNPPGMGLPSTSLKVLHTSSAWHFSFVGRYRRMLLIRFSGRSSRLMRPCSCVHTLFCWSGIPD